MRAGWMRPSWQELLERHPRELAAHAVEAREHDRVRRVVDDEVDPGEVLQGADVAPLAADDPALHVVAGELDDRHRRLRRVARGEALHRDGEDAAHAALGVALGLVLDLAQDLDRVVAGLVLDLLDEQLLGLRRAHARRRARARARAPGGASSSVRRSSSSACVRVGQVGRALLELGGADLELGRALAQLGRALLELAFAARCCARASSRVDRAVRRGAPRRAALPGAGRRSRRRRAPPPPPPPRSPVPCRSSPLGAGRGRPESSL